MDCCYKRLLYRHKTRQDIEDDFGITICIALNIQNLYGSILNGAFNGNGKIKKKIKQIRKYLHVHFAFTY